MLNRQKKKTSGFFSECCIFRGESGLRKMLCPPSGIRKCSLVGLGLSQQFETHVWHSCTSSVIGGHCHGWLSIAPLGHLEVKRRWKVRHVEKCKLILLLNVSVTCSQSQIWISFLRVKINIHLYRRINHGNHYFVECGWNNAGGEKKKKKDSTELKAKANFARECGW